MLQKQSLRLDESQELECQQLKDRLQYELDILMAYQSKNRIQAQNQRDRERKELEDRVSVRRALLENKVGILFFFSHRPIRATLTRIFRYFHIKMEAELQQFNTERSERIRQSHDKHEKELESFDDESTRLGFR